jgi:argonaute-like protein implicated in RNA metabolism and viral defense
MKLVKQIIEELKDTYSKTTLLMERFLEYETMEERDEKEEQEYLELKKDYRHIKETLSEFLTKIKEIKSYR